MFDLSTPKKTLIFLFTIAATSSFGQVREYIGYDGKAYNQTEFEDAVKNPHKITPPKAGTNGEYYVPRSADGHYYINGYVNGFPVQFMVDTGATNTVLPTRFARNVGLRMGRVVYSDTAGGRERGGATEGNNLMFGPFYATGVSIITLEKLQNPLLGVDVLNRYQITYANGFMTIRAPR